MSAFVRSWWLRQALILIVAEVLGYLLSIELRDRYPQEFCFVAIYFVMTVLDERHARRKSRRTENAAHRSAAGRAAPNANGSANANPVILLRPPGA
jgi:hypothetical protein